MKEINTLIISGCLAKQNFQKENEGKIDSVFHHYLNEILRDKYQTELNITILRYERFNTTYERFLQYYEKHTPEIIIFQIRFFHLFKLIGLRSYFIDKNNKGKRDFNIPLFKSFSNEIYDPFLIYTTHYPDGLNIKVETKSKILYNILKYIYRFCHGNQIKEHFEKLNLIFGLIIGNFYFAMKEYYKLIEKIIQFSLHNNLKLIFLSTYPKPKPFIEYMISVMLFKSTKHFFYKKNFAYIDLFQKYSDKGEYLFCDDNLHLNTIAHNNIAKKLLIEVEHYINKNI
jgi:hypothetical protein